MKKFYKVIIGGVAAIIILLLIYSLGLKYPKLLHIKHEYKGYTYYTSIFEPAFDEKEATYAFDLIFENEPDYVFILNSFYADGYDIYFDDIFTYAWCIGEPTRANNTTACMAHDRTTGNIKSGMFINYTKGLFTDCVFFHELSHYVDNKLGDISLSEEFALIYDEEYKNSTLAQDRYYLDKREYFAEESAYYILQDSFETLHAKYEYYNRAYLEYLDSYEDVPKTFEFIKKSLDALKQQEDM